MAKDNVAILSIVSKFDEASARQAAQKAGKTYEQAMSDIGNNTFSENIINQFDKAMKEIKTKLKGINLSSYSNKVLDSLMSDKDIQEKTKDIEIFVRQITTLRSALKGLPDNSFDNLKTQQLDVIIKKQEKIIQKNAEIQEKSKKIEAQANKTINSKIRQFPSIRNDYGNNLDYSKSIDDLSSFLSIDKELNDEQLRLISHLGEAIGLYNQMENSKPEKGTIEAIKYSKDLLTIVKDIQNTSSEIDLFSKRKASKYSKSIIDKKYLDDNLTNIKESWLVSGAKQDYIKKELLSINSQAAKLSKELNEYIANAIQKTLEKINNNAEQSIKKTTENINKLETKIQNVKNNLSENPIEIIDNSQVESIDEIEDRIYELYDRYDQTGGDLETNEYKEFISLYQKFLDLSTKQNYPFDPNLTVAYDDIIRYDDELKQYAETVSRINQKNSELKDGFDNIDKPDIKNNIKPYENLESDLKEIKESIIGLNDKIDSINNTNSIKNLEEQFIALDSKITYVSGDVDKLVDSINLLSSLSLSDIQKTTLPLFNGINELFEKNNGNRISGYWENVKKEVEGSNLELRKLLQNVGLFDSKSNSLKLISDGLENSGGIIGDSKVLIARKNHNTKFNEKILLKQKLDEAYESGINVSRILDVIGSKESNVFFDIQEKAHGSILGNIYGQGEDYVNTEWLNATDIQIKKFISDLIDLQNMGINVESNLTNIMYDKDKGFSFIDLDLNISDFESNAELLQDHMIRIFGDLEDFYLDNNDDINSKFVVKARERFEKLSEQVQQSYAEAQDSHSPSKDFEKLEKDAIDGIELGYSNNEERLINIGRQMATNIKNGFKEEISNIGTSLDAESLGMIDLSYAIEEATKAKKDFALANKEVQDSVDNSEPKLDLESNLMNNVATSAKEATKAKNGFKNVAKSNNNSSFTQSNSSKNSDSKIWQERFNESINNLVNPNKNNESLNQLNRQLKEEAQAAEKAAQKNKSAFESIKKFSNSINISKYQKQNPQSNEYISNLTKLKNMKEELDKLLFKNSNVDFISEKDLIQMEKIKSDLKEIKNIIDNMSSFEKGTNPAKSSGILLEIEKIRNEFKGMNKEQKASLDLMEMNFRKNINSNSLNVGDAIAQLRKFREELLKTNTATNTLWNAMKDKAFYNLAQQLGTFFSFYDFIRYGRQAIQTIIELDTAMTELRKVSDTTESRLSQSFKASTKTAKELGSSISEVINSTADWARLGYDIDAAEKLAEITTLYQNVGDGISQEDASQSLVSTLQGFQLAYTDAESVIDKFNEVANNFAIDTAGIGEALQRSAASFNAANTDLSKSIALITATNEVVQDPTSVGTLWKTLSARIRGAKTELEELGEETDDYTETTSKLRDLVLSLTGFDIMLDENTFKDVYDIIVGISEKWDTLTDVEQASLGEALAGKRNANALYAVIGNVDTLKNAYETAENSAGSARKEQENYAKSIQYSLDVFKASFEEIYTKFLNSDTVKQVVDGGTEFIKILEVAGTILNPIISSLGEILNLVLKIAANPLGFGIIGAGGTSAAIYKNLDRLKLPSLKQSMFNFVEDYINFLHGNMIFGIIYMRYTYIKRSPNMRGITQARLYGNI